MYLHTVSLFRYNAIYEFYRKEQRREGRDVNYTESWK